MARVACRDPACLVKQRTINNCQRKQLRFSCLIPANILPSRSAVKDQGVTISRLSWKTAVWGQSRKPIRLASTESRFQESRGARKQNESYTRRSSCGCLSIQGCKSPRLHHNQNSNFDTIKEHKKSGNTGLFGYLEEIKHRILVNFKRKVEAIQNWAKNYIIIWRVDFEYHEHNFYIAGRGLLWKTL